MIAIRKETGQRLQVLRGNKKWDDLMNNMINTYLRTVPSFGVSKQEINERQCTVTGLRAFEIKKGDIINITGTAEENNEDVDRFARVTEVTPIERHDGVTAHIKYDWVEL
jgi:hypothetical protein